MGNLKDYATSTILTPPSPATSGTTIVLQTGHGARFPATPFMVTVHPPSEFPTLDNAEKLEVTARTDDTLTVLRAQGSTTAKSIEAGWRISNNLFLADIPVVDSTTVDAAGATMNTDTNVKTNSWVVDEDNMSSNVDTKVPTQQSVKAYVDSAIAAAKQAVLPVGSIVVLGVSTNPATLYGFGTWTAIEGKVLVGKAASGTFGTLDRTGGVESYNMTTGMLVGHWHSIWLNTNHGDGTPTFRESLAVPLQAGGRARYRGTTGQYVSGDAWGSADGNEDEVSGSMRSKPTTPLSTLQPYVVKYMWQRTA